MDYPLVIIYVTLDFSLLTCEMGIAVSHIHELGELNAIWIEVVSTVLRA